MYQPAFVKNLSLTATRNLCLAGLLVYFVETVAFSASLSAYQIGLFGGAFALFGFYSIYFRQSWLLNVVWWLTVVIIALANAAAVMALLIIYFSQSALYSIGNRKGKVDLGKTPLVVSMVLLLNDLFTVVFLFVLAKHVKDVKSEEKGKRPLEPTPRAIADANQQKAAANNVSFHAV